MDASDTAVLTYWDGRGNAEIIRLMMAASGQKWVNICLSDVLDEVVNV